MRKWTHLIAIIILVLSWLACGTIWMTSKNTREQAAMKIGMSYDTEEDERLKAIIKDVDTRMSTLAITAFVLTLLSAGYIGVWFVTTVLPAIAQRATDIAYGSGEKLEADAMRDAHVHVAKGEYVDAIEDFIAATQQDPLNRQAWREIGKLQMEKLAEPLAAVSNYRKALKQEGWMPDDQAFLLFRLSEACVAAGQKDEAAKCMRDVIEQFPETRHSANARHQLQEWGMA